MADKDKSEEYRKMKEEAFQNLQSTLDDKGNEDKDKQTPKSEEEEGKTPEPGKEQGDDLSKPDKETPEPKPDESDKQQAEGDDYKALYEKAKHRYDVLQGKYNKEIAELQGQVKTLTDSNQVLTNKVEELSQRPTTTPPAEGEGDKQTGERKRPAKDELEQKMLEYVGGDPDFLSTLDEYVQAKLDSSTKDMRDKVEQVSTQSDQAELESFKRQVKSHHPDLDDLIKDPLFGEFCKRYEPTSGYTYGQWLKAHDTKRNVEGIVFILNTYKQSDLYSGSGSSSSDQTDKTINKPPVSPSTRGSTGSGSQKAKKTYTLKEFNELNIKNIKMYNNGRLTKEKYEATKAELQAAVQEGRVTD